MLPFSALMAAAGHAAAATGTGPDGPPTNVSTYLLGGGLIGIDWVSGDADAHTQWAYSATVGGTKVIQGTVSPGVTSVETGSTETEFWWVRHSEFKIYSAWVQADT